jgi:exodeoxyribonuclease V beta subunit
VKPLDPITVPLSGRVLIEASAGTGKTYTIATLYVRLLLERQLDVASILVVTFTRAATAELRDRIRARLLLSLAALEGKPVEPGDELGRQLAARAAQDSVAADRDRVRLTAALREFDQAAIHTIHAFCQRVLAEHALQTELPFTLQLAEHDSALLEDIAADYFSQLTYASPRALVEALHASKVSVESLSKLARLLVRDDGAHVLPSPAPPAFDAAAERRFEEAKEHAAELWDQDRAQLLASWRSSKALKQNTYSPSVIEKSAARFDALRSQGGSILDVARRFTPAALREGAGVRKNTTFDTSHPFYAAMQALTEAAGVASSAVLRARRQLVDHARAAIAKQHADRGELGFDDLLQALDRALSGPGGEALARTLAARMPAALIDEFQDTDPVQYRIFRRIYQSQGTCLCLIGDPKQAIYGFRGADVLSYVQAASESHETRHTLDRNWRSDPGVLGALETLYTRAPRPFLFESIEFVPVRPAPGAHDRLHGDGDHPLQILWVPAEDPRTEGKAALTRGWADVRLPLLIAGEITSLLNGDARIEERVDGRTRVRPVTPADIAVLCRTNAQAKATQNALAALSVPTVLDGDRSVFESEMAQDLAHVLSAIAAPTDGRRLAAALLGPMLGMSSQALADLVGREDGMEPWLEQLARWNALWRERGFVRMFQALLDEAKVQHNVLSVAGGERLFTDLLHLGELLHETSSRERLGPEALLGWFWQQRHQNREGTMAAESAQLRLEHDERALRLTTVHRSKGLEYPIVFCPFAWGGAYSVKDFARFHDPEAGGRATLDLDPRKTERHRDLAMDEQVAEDARLLYVALTRAKHRSYVVWGRFYKADDSPLAYLLHQRLGSDGRESVSKRYKTMSEAQQHDELRALAQASSGTIGVREIGLGTAAHYRRPEPGDERLEARKADRVLHPVARASSFSRLVAAQAALDVVAADEDDERDVDAQSEAEATVAEVADALPLLAPAKVLLHDFPAGPGPGTLIHAIYEHLDFPTADTEAVRALAAPLLSSFGLLASVRLDALAEGILQTLDAPLDAPLDRSSPLRLRQIGGADRLNELEFTLCTRRARGRLSARALAEALQRTDALPDHPEYYARLAALPSMLAAEHVKGFVDLVFRSDGRYYVADYKSNKLGEHALDYGPDAVLAAMSEHHYFLQGHLYALALHRHLQRRLAGYDYEHCFGGIAYLFVRGMAPSHPPGTAVWLRRPSLATLEALGEALGEAPPGDALAAPARAEAGER